MSNFKTLKGKGQIKILKGKSLGKGEVDFPGSLSKDSPN